jgi:hypothetical protein
MLFDPMVLVQYPLQVLAVVAIILFGKSIAAFVLVLALRYPINTAVTVSASLAQIGEFSFILAALGMQLELLPPLGQNLILAGAIISIAVNPLMFSLATPLENGCKPVRTWRASWNARPTRWPNCRWKPRTKSSAARWCWSASAASAAALPTTWWRAACTSWWRSRTAKSSNSCAPAASRRWWAMRPNRRC